MTQFTLQDVKSFVFTRKNLGKTVKSLGFAGCAVAGWQALVAAVPSLNQYAGYAAPFVATVLVALNEWRRPDR